MVEQIIKQILGFLTKNSLLKTRFFTVSVPAQTTPQGFEIGQGGCIALYLRLDDAGDSIQYGDRIGQNIILYQKEFSKLIFATDLSEVYIKNVPAGRARTVHIQSYHWKWQN